MSQNNHNSKSQLRSKETDKIFSNKLSEIAKFEFNADVAKVFDDMISRSVPFYNEIHHILIDILSRYSLPAQAPIYDFGCSTGHTLSILKQHKLPNPLIGIDSSQEMINKAKEKIEKVFQDPTQDNQIELVCDDLRSSVSQISPASLIAMNYTLQFIPLEDRDKLLSDIHSKLVPGGLLFLAEKVKSPSPFINELLNDLYYDFKKRNGYSELEIAQKREALENVLIPVSSERQLAMLREAGFVHVDMIFRWYNFACYIGIKK